MDCDHVLKKSRVICSWFLRDGSRRRQRRCPKCGQVYRTTEKLSDYRLSVLAYKKLRAEQIGIEQEALAIDTPEGVESNNGTEINRGGDSGNTGGLDST